MLSDVPFEMPDPIFPERVVVVWPGRSFLNLWRSCILKRIQMQLLSRRVGHVAERKMKMNRVCDHVQKKMLEKTMFGDHTKYKSNFSVDVSGGRQKKSHGVGE